MTDFYLSDKWIRLRYRALRIYGNRCMCCGNFGEMHVDHIKPRSNYPRLALNLKNLQILCKACNLGKSNLHRDDWRSRDWKTMIRIFLNIKK